VEALDSVGVLPNSKIPSVTRLTPLIPLSSSILSNQNGFISANRYNP
jgi:hypothetical protein